MSLQKVAGLFHCRFRLAGQDRERERAILSRGDGLDADSLRGILRTLEADNGAAEGEIELVSVSLLHDVIELHETENSGEAKPAGGKTPAKAAKPGR